MVYFSYKYEIPALSESRKHGAVPLAARGKEIAMPRGKQILGLPKGKHLFGTAKVGEKGQIVIPKAARDKFGLKGGDRLIVISDENGIALLPAEDFERKLRELEEMILNKP